MVRPTEQAPICQSSEEVAVRAGHEVLMEIGNSILLIVGDAQRILDQQLRPHPIYSLNIVIILNKILLNNLVNKK